MIKASTHEDVYLPYAVGTEAVIHKTIRSLWAK
jgi:hypothetical protein